MTVKTNPIYISTQESAQHILSKYDNFLFDCDGVIWLDDKLIPKVDKLLTLLRQQNKKFIFVSNNSSKSRQVYLDKFAKLGITNIAKSEIYPTCYAAALELYKNLKIPPGSKIWVLGDEGIERELTEMGYVPIGGTDPLLDTDWQENHPLLTVDPEVEAIVVGSTKKFNYMRIATTLQYLLYNNKSIPFIGTNIDRSFPGPEGLILPAGGSMVNYMAYTSDREFINVGKPSGEFLDVIVKDQGFNKDRTLMVGDTLYTDIKFGNDGQLGDGHGSLLVLSGGTKFNDLTKVLENRSIEDEGLIPSFYIESLTKFIDLLE
ncbi:4-nitrophenylphosphatase [Spathaspora sp. JA1]|nr:4-nitrophenylphosphatase [Spathaspora sp. JA1]